MIVERKQLWKGRIVTPHRKEGNKGAKNCLNSSFSSESTEEKTNQFESGQSGEKERGKGGRTSESSRIKYELLHIQFQFLYQKLIRNYSSSLT